MEHSLGQRSMAEALGTALLVLVGPGSVVATLKLGGDAAFTGADLLGISFAFGLMIAAMVYSIGKSPAATSTRRSLSLATTKRFPWKEVPAYMTAQVVGAVVEPLRSGLCSPRAESTSEWGRRRSTSARPVGRRDLRGRD